MLHIPAHDAPDFGHELHIGRQPTGFLVCPDGVWAGMWRIHAPDGRVSDMVNLPRAKDAAVAWARPRGIGGGELVRWRRRETGGMAPCARLEGLPAPPRGAGARVSRRIISCVWARR
jgi:hypothetical protein